MCNNIDDLDSTDSFNMDDFVAKYELVEENQPDMDELDIQLHNEEFCNNDNRS